MVVSRTTFWATACVFVFAMVRDMSFMCVCVLVQGCCEEAHFCDLSDHRGVDARLLGRGRRSMHLRKPRLLPLPSSLGKFVVILNVTTTLVGMMLL